MSYRLWVDAKRTVLVRFWENGRVEVSTRDEPWDFWGPPIPMIEEKIPEVKPSSVKIP